MNKMICVSSCKRVVNVVKVQNNFCDKFKQIGRLFEEKKKLKALKVFCFVLILESLLLRKKSFFNFEDVW